MLRKKVYDDRYPPTIDDQIVTEPSPTKRQKNSLGFITEENDSIGFINSNVFTSKKKKSPIDEEIATLENLYKHNRDIINFETNQLKKRIAINKEPESVKILETKIDKERTYIQNSII